MRMKSKIVLLLFTLICTLIFPSALRAEKKLCLTMIVKNESRIIERCLDSMKEIVDCISICDTGSTDNTVEIIEDYLERENIPGMVHRHEWKNFGHNRSLSVVAAQQMLEEMGFSLKDTYLLLLDADMILKIEPSFNKNFLWADSYAITQKNHSYAYYNTRLIRASMPWECVGVTHEYWSCKIRSADARLDSLWIDDRDDGGSKADKFERDVRLLTKGVEDEPENYRYVFYLATSYHCLEKFDEAIEWYRKRISMGGYYEEVWYSKYMIGTIYEELKQWDQALACYLEAFQYNPYRAEPLQRISKYYLMNGQNDLAYFFAKQGAEIPYPYNESLFISFPVYEYLFDEDISIAAYYTSHKDEGFAAVNRLMLKKSLPGHVREQAYHNALYYVGNLKNAAYRPINFNLPFIRAEYSLRYNPTNPSIKKTEQGFDVICRTVNYLQIGAKHYHSLDFLDSTNTIRTKNFLLQYDQTFNLLSQHEIIDQVPRERYWFMNVEGLEDCRILEFNDSVWFTCTTLDTNPYRTPQISLCKLADEKSSSSVQVEKLLPLLGPNPMRCEKNWLPFVKDDEIHVIYSYDPFIIYKPAIESKYSLIDDKVLVQRKEQKYDLTRFCGSAAPIAFDDGYLLLVHETLYEDGRIYLHRFVYTDKDFNITQLSKPFIYLHKGIEYCCGMALDHAEENLIMSIGLEDREAYLCIVDIDTVRSMLEPLK